MALIRELSDGNEDGTRLGQSTTDKVAFFGTAPIVQPSGAAQAELAITVVAPITGTFNSTVLIASFTSVIAQTNALRLALYNLGLIKGGA